MSSDLPQHDGPQTTMSSRSLVEIIAFSHSFGKGRAYPTVHESNENQNVDSLQSR